MSRTIIDYRYSLGMLVRRPAGISRAGRCGGVLMDMEEETLVCAFLLVPMEV